LPCRYSLFSYGRCKYHARFDLLFKGLMNEGRRDVQLPDL
jgi:hypothetical protein